MEYKTDKLRPTQPFLVLETQDFKQEIYLNQGISHFYTFRLEKTKEIHNTSPVATAAIGRLLTAASIMGSMMKGEKDVLTLQIECGGPIGGITVTADSNADVKGYVNNPNVILPPNAQGKLDVSGALGPGFLNVIKDIGLREPYNGQTHLV